jgi:hypothetical protein
MPFSDTREMTDGLYVCDSTELAPEIDPWYPTKKTASTLSSMPSIM